MKRPYEISSQENKSNKLNYNTYNQIDYNLNKAVLLKDVGKVKTLLDKGADPGLKYDMNSALKEAIFDKSIGIIEMLLEYGADVNNKDNFENIPLTYATRGQNLEVIEMLLNYGAIPNHKNYNNESPISYALGENNINLVKILLKSGADINYQDIKSAEILNLMKFADFVDNLLVNDEGHINMHTKLTENELLLNLVLENQNFIVARIKKHFSKVEGDSLKKYKMKKALEFNVKALERFVGNDMNKLCEEVLNLDNHLNHEDGFPKLKTLIIQALINTKAAPKKFALFTDDLKDFAKKAGWRDDTQINLEVIHKVAEVENLLPKVDLTNIDEYNQLTGMGSLFNETV